jgi:hypothetical protein
VGGDSSRHATRDADIQGNVRGTRGAENKISPELLYVIDSPPLIYRKPHSSTPEGVGGRLQLSWNEMSPMAGHPEHIFKQNCKDFKPQASKTRSAPAYAFGDKLKTS